MRGFLKQYRETFNDDYKWKLFILSILTAGLAYGLYKGVIDNYLAEIVEMGEFDRGVSEFFRELPGLLLVFILAVIWFFSAEAVYKIGAVVMIIGMAMHAMLPPGKVMITLAIFVFSLGEHLQLGMKSSISLQYSKPGRGGEALGLMNSSYWVGKLIGYVIVVPVFLVVSGLAAFRGFFWISTAISAVSAALALKMPGASTADPNKRKFYFSKKYSKYYGLEVFYGARKQVFFTFGPYVLILFYGASTWVISLLFAVSSVACFLLSPLVGKIIDRLGYRIVMISDTLILVIVCFFYGFAHHIFPKDVAFIICCVNYVLDSVISLASMASSVYVKDIAESDDEMHATISTGVSVNHLITLFISLFGGWVWQTVGIETLFIISAVLGLCNSAYAASLKTGRRPVKTAEA